MTIHAEIPLRSNVARRKECNIITHMKKCIYMSIQQVYVICTSIHLITYKQTHLIQSTCVYTCSKMSISMFAELYFIVVLLLLMVFACVTRLLFTCSGI